MGFIPDKVKELDAFVDKIKDMKDDMKQIIVVMDKFSVEMKATRESIDRLSDGMKAGRQLAGSIDRAVDFGNKVVPKLDEVGKKVDDAVYIVKKMVEK
jgi:hypothetical protein